MWVEIRLPWSCGLERQLAPSCSPRCGPPWVERGLARRGGLEASSASGHFSRLDATCAYSRPIGQQCHVTRRCACREPAHASQHEPTAERCRST
eukprot:2238651-Prymnesium_polylepis.1